MFQSQLSRRFANHSPSQCLLPGRIGSSLVARTLLVLCIAITLLASSQLGFSQTPSIYTVAGSGAGGGLQRMGQAVADSQGNVYVADGAAYRIIKVANPTGATPAFTVIAGTGVRGLNGDNGPAVSAQLQAPCGVALDALEAYLYIADGCGDPAKGRVRRVDLNTGTITFVASGFNPQSIAVDSHNNVFIADGNDVYKITSGAVSKFYSSASWGWLAYVVAIDRADVNDTVYFSGFGTASGIIVKIPNTNGTPGTPVIIAGADNCCWDGSPVPPLAMNMDYSPVLVASGGYIYFNSQLDQRIGRFASDGSGTVQLIAGNGTNAVSGDNGLAINAGIGNYDVYGMAVAGSEVFFGGDSAQLMRYFSVGGNIQSVSTPGNPNYLGDNGPATSATISNNTMKVAFDASGNMYIADQGNRVVRKVDEATNTITTAVTGVQLDTGLAAGTHVGNFNITNDAAGNIYIATDSNGLFKLAGGAFTRVALASAFSASPLRDIAYNPVDGYLYVIANSAVDKIKGDGTSHSVVYSGGGVTRLSLAVDSLGKVWATQASGPMFNTLSLDQLPATGTHLLTSIGAQAVATYPVTGDPRGGVVYMDNFAAKSLNSGVTTTIAGQPGTDGFSGDNGPAVNSQLSSALGLAFDKNCNLYISDSENQRIRKVENLITASVGSDQSGIALSVDGVDGGGSFVWTSGTAHTLATTSPQTVAGTKYIFTQWSLPGNQTNTSLSTAVTAPCLSGSYTANFMTPPTLAMSFGAPVIPTNGSTSLSFTINNPNSSNALTGVALSDTLPAGLKIASPSDLASSCGGTASATTGASLISLSGATLSANSSCTFSVNVTGISDGVQNNTTGNISSTETGDGNTASASITVINPPTIAEAFGAASIPLNGTTSLTFTLSSTNANLTLNGVAFTDNLPPGLVVATPGNLNSTCNGTATAANGASSISLSGASLAPGASCTVSVHVQGVAVGAANNSVTVSDTNSGTGNTATALVTVVKADTSTTVTSSANSSFFGQSVTITATVSPVPSGTGTATGTVTFLDDGSPIGTGTLSGGVATFTTSALAVSSHTITTSYGGDASFNGSTGSLTGNPQVVNSASTTTTVALTSGGNPSVFGQSLTFTATVSPQPPGAGTPAGTVTFMDGGTGLGVGTINSSGRATYTTSTLAVSNNHSITAVYTPSDANFTGSTSSTLTQSVSKANTTTTVTSSMNPSVFGQSVTFTATVSPVAPGAGTANDGEAVMFLDNGSPIGNGALSGGVATFTASALAIGNHTITTSYGGDASFNGSTGSLTGNPQVVNKASTTTTVSSSPNPSVFGSSVTFTATVSPIAPGAGAATGTVTFMDGGTTLGTGTTNSSGLATYTTSTLGVNNNHGIVAIYGGDTNFTGSTSSTLTQSVSKADTTTAVISPQNPSVFGQSVTITATVSPVPSGTGTATGTVTFLDGGSPIGTGTLSGGVATFTTSALAVGNHTITTSYGGNANFNGSTGSLTGNPQVINKSNATATVTSSQNPSLSGQSVTFTAMVSPVAPGAGTPTGTVTFSDNGSPIGPGTLGGGAATFTTSTLLGGSHTITASYSGDSNFNSGTGSLTGNPQVVVSAPAITKAFGASQIPLNGTTSLTFTIQNPNTNATLTGIAFTDNLPAGLVISTPNALNSTCGGTAMAVAGAGSASLSGATLAANTSCTISLNITGTTAGVKNNSVQVTSTEGGTGNTSNASIGVVGPPVIIKAFGAASIPLNGSTSLSFTIQNDNATTTLTGVGFSDTLPAGLVISTPSGQTGTCGGGTITATQGASVISLSGASIAASSSCTFSVNVTGTAAGTQNNTTGNVTSAEGGTGGTASASTTVIAPPVIAKAFHPSAVLPGTSVSLTFTITNPAVNTVALTGVAFTDMLPSTLTVVGGSTNVCGGILDVGDNFPDPNILSLSGATIASGATCQFSVTLGTTQAGQFFSATSPVTSTNGGTGNTASASLIAAFPPVILNNFSVPTIPLNGAASLTFTITNPALNLTPVNGVAFNDILPAGLVIAVPNGLSSTCGGTTTAVAGSSSLSLSGATLPVGETCTISVTVQGMTAGVKNNTTGAISSTESGPGAPSNTATLAVLAPPVIADSFGAASIPLGGTTSLIFSITNPNPGNALTGVAFTNTLPTGLVVSTPNALTGTCGGTIAAVPGANSLSLTGATLAGDGSCTFSVNVTGIHAGTQVNTTGNVTSVDGGTGGTASASLTVNQASTTTTVVTAGSKHFGEAATFTATVSSTVATPAGSVTFMDGTTTLGSAALSSGVATFSDSTLTLGTHSITAQYQGSSDYIGSVSAAVSQEVTVPLITINAGSASLTVTVGGSGTLPLTIGSAGTLSAPVTPSCSGLPVGTQCVFSPASVGPTGLPATTTLTITTTRFKIMGQNKPMGLTWVFGMVLPGICLLPFAGKRGKRRWLQLSLGLALLLMLTLGVGCGGSPNSSLTNIQQSTTPGTYTVTVTGTSTGATQASMNINLIVTP